MAKTVPISLIVHRLSFFVFVCNKLSLNDLCSLLGLIGFPFSLDEPFGWVGSLFVLV